MCWEYDVWKLELTLQKETENGCGKLQKGPGKLGDIPLMILVGRQEESWSQCPLNSGPANLKLGCTPIDRTSGRMRVSPYVAEQPQKFLQEASGYLLKAESWKWAFKTVRYNVICRNEKVARLHTYFEVSCMTDKTSLVLFRFFALRGHRRVFENLSLLESQKLHVAGIP